MSCCVSLMSLLCNCMLSMIVAQPDVLHMHANPLGVGEKKHPKLALHTYLYNLTSCDLQLPSHDII